MTDFSSWIGRSEERQDRLDPARSNALLAALGHDEVLAEGDGLPPLHHWLYFWNLTSPDSTGTDGHPRRGGFLPAVELPRRMWAGGRLAFHSQLRLGGLVRRVSTIRAIERKEGRSGELVFVTVHHSLLGSDGLAIEEEQDLVYRDDPRHQSASPAAKVEVDEPVGTLFPDEVLLFRYSALTMNSHRIHYDAPYASAVEHYPGLVVHGPLQATALARLAEHFLGGPLAHFAFRGVAPAFAGRRLDLHCAASGRGIELWMSQGGQRTMTATARK